MNTNQVVVSDSANSKPKVSIGMPVYNGAEFIRSALDSLLAQTFTDFELIISDNASTDETEAICREYAAKDKRIRYIRQRENLGATANFKYVLDEAVGEYFMWAAHDDTWNSRFLLVAVETLDRDSSIEYVMPTFAVKSIKLRIGKSFPEYLFAFIENRSPKYRLLNYMALHHCSHKCNIVYSIFRKTFLLYVWARISISNDGLMGAVIVHAGRGALARGEMFNKRYVYLWPGSLDFLYRLLIRPTPAFQLALASSLTDALRLFPEYGQALKALFSIYKPYSYGKNFAICDPQILEDLVPGVS
ncbi:glycosyltransferase family 2 protein [Calditerrivibrio nitroreducens]|uniref:Glycosyl transferase family 2 n=1 Tax=Calditerrivibrio nitroreducens (strain DSM 19672 / NBRC 101217 / Yu37-1) TaxID=768670 RepID=E4TIL6_CALNY|nr:glycosyltransferase [Calditerrivibrio nitroreducens]ADR19064.1 glycosyl transferase family 2 [Calditerrivibrio nitroreducens DSM 19672]